MLENQEPLEGNLLDQRSGNQSNLWKNSFEEWDQWDEILNLIESEQCILMLGPNISTSSDNVKSYIELLSQTLIKRLNLSPKNSTSPDNSKPYIELLNTILIERLKPSESGISISSNDSKPYIELLSKALNVELLSEVLVKRLKQRASFSISSGNGKPHIQLVSEALNDVLLDEALVERLKRPILNPPSFSKVAANYRHIKSDAQFYNRVQKFYGQNLNPSESFKYIAKMPFPLIINTSPDHLLKEAYEHAIFDYYNYKSNRPESNSSGTAQHPLIYNLFGSAVEPESLVVTEKDRLNFLVNCIRREPPLPKNLLNNKIINEKKMFLFVGFDFNEWYLRLLLNLLRLDNKSFACAIDRHDVETNQDTRVFYTHNFNVNFLDAPFDIFIKKLYQKYSERNPLSNFVKETAEGSSITIKRDESFSPIVPEVLITASMADKNFVVELEKMLQPAVLSEKINVWDGSKIKSGNVKEQLEQRINRAQIIVICLSPDSLNYLLRNEIIPAIIKRQEENSLIKVIPILHKNCQYHLISYIAGQAIFPKNDQGNTTSISAWQEKADAYNQIAEIIIQNIEA